MAQAPPPKTTCRRAGLGKRGKGQRGWLPIGIELSTGGVEILLSFVDKTAGIYLFSQIQYLTE